MRTTLLSTLLCSLGMALSPCVHPAHEPAEPATRPEVPDAARPRPQPVLSPCEAACKNAARLGCEHWGGSPGADGSYGNADDVPCAKVCQDIEDASAELVGVSLHPECVARAANCTEVKRCFD